MSRRLTDEKRDAILDGARSAFAELGYHSTSIAEISKRAGVARATFYRYFEGKREALSAVLDDLLTSVWQQVRPIDPSSIGSVRTQVRENVTAIIGLLVRNPDLIRILFAEAAGADHVLEEKVRQFYRRLFGLLEGSLETGQKKGIIAPEADVAVLAVCLIGVVKEVLYQHLLGTRFHDPEAVTKEIERLVAHGIYGAG